MPTHTPAPVLATISPLDAMRAVGDEGHYFSVGADALRWIHRATATADLTNVRQILDVPCGHGRVLRHLRAAYPHATLTACDLDRDGVAFCAQAFDAIPVVSHDDPAKIPLPPDTYDLIWVGSLLTHLDAARFARFLTVLHGTLRPGGLLVFTTHGRRVHEWMRRGTLTYELPPARLATVMRAYERRGFGYAPYRGSQTYGVSLSRLDWVMETLSSIPHARIVSVSEAAWDQHQDVIAITRDDHWHVPPTQPRRRAMLARATRWWRGP